MEGTSWQMSELGFRSPSRRVIPVAMWRPVLISSFLSVTPGSLETRYLV